MIGAPLAMLCSPHSKQSAFLSRALPEMLVAADQLNEQCICMLLLADSARGAFLKEPPISCGACRA